jgi:hypothetical protein
MQISKETMKEFIQIFGIVVGGSIGGIVLLVMGFYLLFGFFDWVTTDPFNIRTEYPQLEDYTVYRECVDNDNPSFNQEYTDKKIQSALDEAIENNPNKMCEVKYRGKQDILGCTGDLYYSITCN